MNTLKTIVWLFPIIFMLHDFEEIILVEAWKKKYKKELQNTTMKKVPFSDFRSAASFSIGVVIEFLIFSALPLFACLFNWYFLWFGLFFGFTFHLVIHCKMSLQFKHYVPGVATSIPFLPICIYLLWISAKMISFTTVQLILSCVTGTILMLLIVAFLHKYMDSFAGFIKKMEH